MERRHYKPLLKRLIYGSNINKIILRNPLIPRLNVYYTQIHRRSNKVKARLSTLTHLDCFIYMKKTSEASKFRESFKKVTKLKYLIINIGSSSGLVLSQVFHTFSMLQVKTLVIIVNFHDAGYAETPENLFAELFRVLKRMRSLESFSLTFEGVEFSDLFTYMPDRLPFHRLTHFKMGFDNVEDEEAGDCLISFAKPIQKAISLQLSKVCWDGLAPSDIYKFLKKFDKPYLTNQLDLELIDGDNASD